MNEYGSYPIVILLVTAAAICLRWMQRRKIDPLDPFFLVMAFFIFTFLLRPLSYEYGMTGYLKGSTQIGVIQDAMYYGIIFFIAFTIGYLYVAKIKMRVINFRLPYVKLLELKYLSITKLRIFLLFLVFALIVVGLIQTHGGIAHVLSNRATVYVGAGPIVAMLYWGLIAFLVVYALWINGKVTTLTVISSFGFVVVLLIISTGERLRVLEVMLGMIILYHYNKCSFRFRSILVILLTITVLLTLMLLYRKLMFTGGGEDTTFVVLDSFFRNFLLFDGFVAVLEKVPDEIEYSYGSGYVLMFIGLIPRVIWPEKPEWGKAVFTKEVFGIDDSVFTYGIVGELWWNFGFIGIVLGGVVYGIMLRKLYAYVIRYKDDPVKVIIYFLLMTSLVLRGFKGGLESAMMEIIIKMLMFVPAILFIARFTLYQKRKAH